MSRVIQRVSSLRWISKVVEPIVNISKDYYVTFSDAGQFSRQHPFRTAFYFSVLGAAAYMWRKKPDFVNYTDSVVSWSNEIALVPASIKNKKSQRYIERIFLMLIRDKLSCVNLGVLSVVVERRQYPSLRSFHETCPMLKTPWYSMHRNIVDVGVLGRWIYLRREMEDYDISDEEWLPVVEETRS